MRAILEMCVRVDELAASAYLDMQSRCADPAIAGMCGEMAAEEAVHAQWWRELIEAWDDGLLADAWAASDASRKGLADAVAELERYGTGSKEPLDAESVLMTAARIEFFALDTAFAELLELVEPGIARSRHLAYSTHVHRLIHALESTFPADSVQAFLASVLRRSEDQDKALSRYATHDQLTGLGNRRALAAQAQQWASWAARYGSAVSVLVVDIDHFESVNDAWGHAVGDRVLVAIAEAICGAVRGADLVTRYGGAEFVVLAPELEPDGARVVAERLGRVIRELKVSVSDDAYVSVTASVGIATLFDPPDSEPRNLDTILAAATRSLHAAKRSGRDRAADPVVLLKELPLD